MTGPAAHDPDEAEGGVPLAEKVAFLQHPGAYPEHPNGVDIMQTHMSWVFLTDRHAYKLKKPVRTSVLDFSTIDARKVDCEAEVRLNRRLAPHVYLGLVPLVVGDDGRLHLGGTGHPVDWLVRMVRLASRRQLDQAILSHGVHGSHALKLGQVLARFYASAPRLNSDPEHYRHGFATEIAVNLQEVVDRAPALAALADTAAATQGAGLAAFGGLLEERARQGRIVEAHGDLRPEHIFLNDEPVIIDCLEFNRSLRLLDPVDELAFLGLECERLGAPWIGDVVLDVYRTATGDTPPAPLLDFYRSFRAGLRARLAARRLDEADGRRPHWLERLRSYLILAVLYGERLSPTTVTRPAGR
jgi:aminoglycoside phosphotransferase family enzyme